MPFKLLDINEKPSQAKWSRQRLDELIVRPKHKPQREKSVILPAQDRNNSPMTMEDKFYKNSDLDLLNSLRV